MFGECFSECVDGSTRDEQDYQSALEIRTKKLRAKVAPNSEKLGATLKSWGPSSDFDHAS